MRGEKIYEYDLDIVNVTDFGASLYAILGGQEPVPLQGARFDVGVAGSIAGRISGSLQGIDYFRVRADGRREIDLRATIETDDGERIAFVAEGIAIPRESEPIVDLSLNIHLDTAAPAYAWLEARQTWGVGRMDQTTRKIHVDAYLQ